MQGACAYLVYTSEDFPVSMESAAGIFSLSMHPYLAEQDQAMIADVIQKAYKYVVKLPVDMVGLCV